jgi:hypothetical protein
MYHVLTVWGHAAFGNSPLAAQTSTRATLSGVVRTISPPPCPWLRSASTTRNNSGAATCTPTNAGLPELSKLPIHTTNT